MKKFFMAVIALMMTISASAQFYIYFSDGTVAKVDSISMVAPNPSLDDGDNNDATNTFFAGTPESRGFYTPSEAIAAVDAGMIYTGDSIKVGGIISRWYKKSSRFDSYRSVSFFVMDPVTGQEHEFEFYNCYSLGKDSFATYDFTDEVNAICIDEQGREFHVGDTVVGSGEYSYYEAYALHELKTNCYLTEWRPIEHKEAEPDTPTEPEEPTNPSAGIGVFSVSADKQVTFSKGNLQYTQSTNTWSFAENQWDMIGTDNVTGGSVSSDQYGDSKHGDALADKIDLFGWSASNTTAPFGVSTSKDYDDYYGSFVDWGTNQIGSDAPNTWRTLTYDEWYYLRYNRANANDLVGVAQVNGVNGLIFLPDTWVCPESVTFKSGFHSSGGVDYYAAYQTFTADQWSKLEAAGAVFLPASGYRYGSNVYDVQGNGEYWSATEYDGIGAYCLYFNSSEAYMGYSRTNGFSVRLVKDVEDEPVEPENMENGYEYVDLGLSVKWATCNVGASKPEEYGDYFAWGETEPKSTYNWSTYKWCNGSYDTQTKYNTNSSYGTVDNKTTLDLSDDAACANWGGSWRMPTDAELTELREQCTWTWTTQNGVYGYKVTSKSNGNSIFLPAAGYRRDSSLNSAGSYGFCWSSSLITDAPGSAYLLHFGSIDVSWGNNMRYFGHSVRPVCQ